MKRPVPSPQLRGLIEGVIRVALFVAYVKLISCMEDIKRVFMYHGAEHKSINCVENGKELTVENVRMQTTVHKRCGTSFLCYVCQYFVFHVYCSRKCVAPYGAAYFIDSGYCRLVL